MLIDCIKDMHCSHLTTQLLNPVNGKKSEYLGRDLYSGGARPLLWQ